MNLDCKIVFRRKTVLESKSLQKLQSCFPMILDSCKSLKSSANNCTEF